MKCKYEGTGVWAGRCTGTKEIDPCIGYEKCKTYKSNLPTNADRIRAMSDEELAFFLAEWNENQRAWRRDSEGTLFYWLQEPVKTPTTNADRCVCCGAIIPEGSMVCTNCNGAVNERRENNG